MSPERFGHLPDDHDIFRPLPFYPVTLEKKKPVPNREQASWVDLYSDDIVLVCIFEQLDRCI